MCYTIFAMGKTIPLEISSVQKSALEKAVKYGTTPSYRLRCQAILKKSEGSSAREIAQKLECCQISVYDWVRRYRQEGITGLAIKKGRGRPRILKEEDLAAVKEAVQKNRRRVALALPEIEQKTGKSLSPLTLRRTLKKMVDASNDCDA